MKKPDEETIKRVLDDQGNAEESRYVITWLGSEEGQRYLAKHIDQQWNNGQIRMPDEIPSTRMWKQISQQMSHPLGFIRFKWQYAAILIPIILVIGFISYRNLFPSSESPIAWRTLSVPYGEKTNLVFQDGTSVFLGPGASIRYPVSFTKEKREVDFSGEAYFDVASNPECPFIIHIGNVSVNVLGTSFNVMANRQDENIQVKLDEGRINLCTNSSQTTLHPGECAVYNKRTEDLSVRTGTNTCYADWKSDLIRFNDALLPDVLEIVSRKYNAHFQITDSTVCHYCYTLTLKGKTLREVLSSMENITPLQFNSQNDTILVSKK